MHRLVTVNRRTRGEDDARKWQGKEATADANGSLDVETRAADHIAARKVDDYVACFGLQIRIISNDTPTDTRTNGASTATSHSEGFNASALELLDYMAADEAAGP
jgi:hypothetical protein